MRRFHWGGSPAWTSVAVLHAATERPDQARPLLDEAFRLGGEIARATATGYPALAPLLAEPVAAPAVPDG